MQLVIRRSEGIDYNDFLFIYIYDDLDELAKDKEQKSFTNYFYSKYVYYRDIIF